MKNDTPKRTMKRQRRAQTLAKAFEPLTIEIAAVLNRIAAALEAKNK